MLREYPFANKFGFFLVGLASSGVAFTPPYFAFAQQATAPTANQAPTEKPEPAPPPKKKKKNDPYQLEKLDLEHTNLMHQFRQVIRQARDPNTLGTGGLPQAKQIMDIEERVLKIRDRIQALLNIDVYVNLDLSNRESALAAIQLARSKAPLFGKYVRMLSRLMTLYAFLDRIDLPAFNRRFGLVLDRARAVDMTGTPAMLELASHDPAASVAFDISASEVRIGLRERAVIVARAAVIANNPSRDSHRKIVKYVGTAVMLQGLVETRGYMENPGTEWPESSDELAEAFRAAGLKEFSSDSRLQELDFAFKVALLQKFPFVKKEPKKEKEEEKKKEKDEPKEKEEPQKKEEEKKPEPPKPKTPEELEIEKKFEEAKKKDEARRITLEQARERAKRLGVEFVSPELVRDIESALMGNEIKNLPDEDKMQGFYRAEHMKSEDAISLGISFWPMPMINPQTGLPDRDEIFKVVMRSKSNALKLHLIDHGTEHWSMFEEVKLNVLDPDYKHKQKVQDAQADLWRAGEIRARQVIEDRLGQIRMTSAAAAEYQTLIDAAWEEAQKEVVVGKKRKFAKALIESSYTIERNKEIARDDLVVDISALDKAFYRLAKQGIAKKPERENMPEIYTGFTEEADQIRKEIIKNYKQGGRYHGAAKKEFAAYMNEYRNAFEACQLATPIQEWKDKTDLAQLPIEFRQALKNCRIKELDLSSFSPAERANRASKTVWHNYVAHRRRTIEQLVQLGEWFGFYLPQAPKVVDFALNEEELEYYLEAMKEELEDSHHLLRVEVKGYPLTHWLAPFAQANLEDEETLDATITQAWPHIELALAKMEKDTLTRIHELQHVADFSTLKTLLMSSPIVQTLAREYQAIYEVHRKVHEELVYPSDASIIYNAWIGNLFHIGIVGHFAPWMIGGISRFLGTRMVMMGRNMAFAGRAAGAIGGRMHAIMDANMPMMQLAGLHLFLSVYIYIDIFDHLVLFHTLDKHSPHQAWLANEYYKTNPGSGGMSDAEDVKRAEEMAETEWAQRRFGLLFLSFFIFTPRIARSRLFAPSFAGINPRLPGGGGEPNARELMAHTGFNPRANEHIGMYGELGVKPGKIRWTEKQIDQAADTKIKKIRGDQAKREREIRGFDRSRRREDRNHESESPSTVAKRKRLIEERVTQVNHLRNALKAEVRNLVGKYAQRPSTFETTSGFEKRMKDDHELLGIRESEITMDEFAIDAAAETASARVQERYQGIERSQFSREFRDKIDAQEKFELDRIEAARLRIRRVIEKELIKWDILSQSHRFDFAKLRTEPTWNPERLEAIEVNLRNARNNGEITGREWLEIEYAFAKIRQTMARHEGSYHGRPFLEALYGRVWMGRGADMVRGELRDIMRRFNPVREGEGEIWAREEKEEPYQDIELRDAESRVFYGDVDGRLRTEMPAEGRYRFEETDPAVAQTFIEGLIRRYPGVRFERKVETRDGKDFYFFEISFNPLQPKPFFLKALRALGIKPKLERQTREDIEFLYIGRDSIDGVPWRQKLSPEYIDMIADQNLGLLDLQYRLLGKVRLSDPRTWHPITRYRFWRASRHVNNARNRLLKMIHAQRDQWDSYWSERTVGLETFFETLKIKPGEWKKFVELTQKVEAKEAEIPADQQHAYDILYRAIHETRSIRDQSFFFDGMFTNTWFKGRGEYKKRNRRERVRKVRKEYANYEQEDASQTAARAGDDYLGLYKALEVKRNATEDEIKQAYRRISKECREVFRLEQAIKEGKLTEAEAEALELRFKNAARAHNVLSDSKTREQYDRGEFNARNL